MSSLSFRVNKFATMHQDKKIALFLAALILYSMILRVLPKELFATIVLLFIISVGILHFYVYTNRIAKEHNIIDKKHEYSWGYIKEPGDLLDMKKFIEFVKSRDYSFFKNYLIINIDKIILLTFIFADFVIAFKNLNMRDAGAFFALSIISKFVFIAYYYVENIYKSIDLSDKNKDEKVLDIFYRQINGILSLFFVIFIMVFILSKYIVEIFFGVNYLPNHSSLPFILLANMFLCVALIVYSTAKRIDMKSTRNILRVYTLVFFPIFVFLSVNYIDNVTYFIIGSSCLLAIFLYNFAVKKLEYISDTYNHLF